MATTTINATPRTPDKPTGRALRREGQVPGIYYNSNRDVEYVQFNARELQRLLASEFGLLDLDLDGRKIPCIIREVQRHPVRGDIIHIDLFGVQSDQKIQVRVPVHIVGVADGVKNEGGTLDVTLHEIDVECLPADLPNRLEVDVTALEINEGIRVSDISFEGIEILVDPQTTVVHVLPPRVVEEEKPEEVEGAEEEGAAEPEVITEKKDDESSD